MPPIPVYTNSPVAAKPAGPTPQTASDTSKEAERSTVPATTTAAATTAQSGYPQARPGAAPSLPAATAATQQHAYIPTPTTGFQQRDGPAAPQPGAFPQAPKTHLPPPPKDGVKYTPASVTTSPPSAAAPYPHQMSIPPPTMAYQAQQSGTSSAAGLGQMYSSQSTTVGNQNLQHPPGYHQDANASEPDRFQRAALNRNDSDYQQQGAEDEGGVWGTAKKWAQATGEKLAAAETEVWKRINKE